MTRRLILPLVVAAAVALGATGCKPEPEPGSVDLVGDSIALQAVLGGSGLEAEPDDWQMHVGSGWTAADVLPWVEAQVASGRPETLIVSLGVNDSAPRNGGWGWDNVATWVDLLDAPHETACVVVILPAVGEGASPELHAEVEKAREGIATVAGMREGPVVLEDWGIVIDADPAVLAPDGVHLAQDPAEPYGIDPYAAQTVTSTYWRGLSQCPS